MSGQRHDVVVTFREHAGWCPEGAPPGGARRLDLFADYSAFPVWSGGCMVSPQALGLSADLTAALKDWAGQWERVASAGIGLAVDPPLSDGELDAVERAFPDLARRLAEETGAVVVGHSFADRRSTECSRCGTKVMEARAIGQIRLRRERGTA
jgi:hypothetical protein